MTSVEEILLVYKKLGFIAHVQQLYLTTLPLVIKAPLIPNKSVFL